jgi:hypothetical protein
MPTYEKTVETIIFCLMTTVFLIPVVVIGAMHFGWCCTDKPSDATPSLAKPAPPEVVDIRLKDIRLQVTPEEILSFAPSIRSMLSICLKGTPALIRVAGRRNLEAFLAQPQPADRFYLYCSDPQSWKYLAGRAGILKIRSGEQVANYELFMN